MIQDALQLNERVFVVAEIGKNFIRTKEDAPGEYLKNAQALIRAAKDAGADAVKFQTHNVEDEQLDILVTSPHFQGSDRYAWVARNTLATPIEFWRELKEYADSLGIMLFTTPMSRGAAQRVASLDVLVWKVGSGDMLDFVLLDYLAETKIPIIVSTGMSVLSEVDQAVAFLRKRGADFALLHCASKYPAQAPELALEMIPNLLRRYNVPIGFSDHSLEIREAAKAVALGARIIEKHFTLSRDDWGSDHAVSLTPLEFRAMVNDVRNTQIGGSVRADGYHFISSRELIPGEEVFRPVFRKSLIAGRNIRAGTAITKEMVYAMRPQQYARGLPSEEYERVLGKKAAKDLKKYDPITIDAIN